MLAGLCAVLMLCLLPLAAMAQQAPAEQPAEVQEFLQLLGNPEVQAWLRTQSAAAVPATAAPEGGIPGFFAKRLNQVRERFDLVLSGAMTIGPSLGDALGRLARELAQNGAFRTLLELLSIPVLAVAGDRMLARRGRQSAQATTGLGRLARLPSLAGLAGFILGAVLPLVLFGWTELLKQAAVLVALALIGIRLTVFLGRLYLEGIAGADAPPAPAAARHGYKSALVLASYFFAGWAFVEMADLFGVTGGPMLLLIYILAFGLCALALLALWRRPRPLAGGDALWTRASWGWSIVLIGLLALWLAGLHVLLWLGIFAVALPKVLAACTKLVRGLQLYVNPEAQIYATRSILLDRGLRALIIAGAAWWIAHLLGLEASGMARGETIENRIARGLMQGVVVVLFADLIWAFAKAQIKMTLETASADAIRSDEQKRRASRLLTLLPIFRNILAAVIGIISVLMVLSGLGVEIAPLLAGAGVVGVAVGFGTQTIVKDVISGMFYLWDDAFRIDEYIETGKYKGTVESFSLRSVKLRHHRGPLTTVPFGELGAVQNMSRDWSVTKFNLRVGYDTDLEKLRKVIKKIGQDLAERPEYKDSIISPLKMKGVVDFGEYAIEVRVGFTTKPGEQFMIRRDAMTMIRQTFRENDIHFAVPTVQVSNPEDGDASAAALAKARHDAALQAAQEGGGA